MLAEPQTDAGPSRLTKRSTKKSVLFVVALGLTALVLSAWKFKVTGQPPFLHRENVWSIAIYEGPSPINLSPISSNKPRLTSADVTDVDALFVADPFMVKDGDAWHMFVEVLNRETNQGDIGVATSRDQRATWKYQKIVLDEPWHLSYPSVFRWEERWYMLPQGDTGIHLYEADSFPLQWTKVATLMTGKDLADPTLFRHNDIWWMFVGRSGTHDQLRLYFADAIEGPWVEHPNSPVVDNDPDIARPGGKVIEYEGDLIRYAQDCAPKYGNQLRAFRITKLNREHYVEEPIAEEFVLRPGSHQWNANGMHHVDAHRMDDGTWTAVVDGHKKTWTLSLTP